jgi:hypothetical protein
MAAEETGCIEWDRLSAETSSLQQTEGHKIEVVGIFL